MKLAIFGAGAIGGYLAVKLQQAGADVTVIARGPHLAAMRANGLTLKSEGETVNVRVRATDKAGNASIQSAVFTVDNLGPTPFETTSSPNPGTHLTTPAQATLTWSPLTDGSGTVTVIAVTDQFTDTVPTTGTSVSGTSYTAHFTGAGMWYVHLVAKDGVGNTTTKHYGPWLVGTNGGTAVNQGIRTFLHGNFDLAFCNQRTGNGRTEKVGSFIDGSGFQQRPEIAGDKFSTEIVDKNL